ncbi:peptidoglycan-binding protein [Paracoccus litorisediminis]|uniref:Peptidoglycan binding domain-containing protein n=1 Tax=Paracoccus litorisediminis TaxID=2006130 RepID=A0A844HJW0_9RHOB|nr:peptidoglycan-binding protein [Paracoccus litorisediminis]MTH59288.1 hypothetical protein [Paracoccus litorisediminis]
MRYFLFLLAALAGAAPAMAENRAVVIGNADYRNAPDLAGSDTAALAAVIRKAGFVTAEGVDLPSEQLRQVLDLLARDDLEPGARVVMLSGRFLNDGSETWYMGTEAQRSGPLGAGAQGVPLGLITQLMANRDAVLLLGTDQQDMPHDQGLTSGIGPMSNAEGVSVVTGSPEAVARALRELAAGRSVARALSVGQGVELLLGGDPQMVPVRPMPAGQEDQPSAPDRSAWAEAAALDTIKAWSTYLERFPMGSFATAARERRAALRLQEQPQVASTLQLAPADQLEIQRALARLGLEPGPLDGRIGVQTREALRDWQRRNRADPTGELTVPQLAELRRQVAALGEPGGKQDRDFWERSGARGGIERLRNYLRRYPEGLFAIDARRQLASSGQHPLLQPRASGDSTTFRWARRQDSAAAYQQYLDRFPQGAHVAEARLRHDNLLATTRAAQQEEAALGLNATTRMLIETRLDRAKLVPGEVDGRFTDDTREALRRYQAVHNLRVTGYVSRQTLNALLAEPETEGARQ